MGIKNIRSIKIDLDGEKTIKKELDIKTKLKKIRIKLLDIIPYQFIFLDEDENEIPKDEESKKNYEIYWMAKIYILKKRRKEEKN